MDVQTLGRQAVELHRQGRLAEAEQMYLQLMRTDPTMVGPPYMLGMIRLGQGRAEEAVKLIAPSAQVNAGDITVLMNYGMALQMTGRAAEALENFRKVIAIRPDIADAHYNSGVALADMARFEEAIDSYEQALALRPDFTIARGNLGAALAAVRRFDDALASYDKVLAVQPADAQTLFNRALALAALDRHAEAVAAFDKALAAAPGFIDAIHNRALSLLTLGRLEDALAGMDAALALQPGNAELHNNRAIILRKLGRPAEALANLDQAVALEPNLAPARASHALALKDLARYREALASYDILLSLEPNNAAGWNGRGAVLRLLNRHAEAVESFSRAIAIHPSAEALNNRAYALWNDLEYYEPALADLELALVKDPDHPYVRGELLHLKMYGADWRDYDSHKAAIDAGVRAGRKVVRPFNYQAVSDSPADLQACSAIFADDHYPALAAPPLPKHDHKKIRIGYVSGEFYEQATAWLMASLYELHDREKFEIIAFDNGLNDHSALRTRLEKAFDRIIPIQAMSDAEAADAIRAAEIDILVNLNGYFGKQRMGVFARRPAPVQVNYLGFPATLGAPYIDYILADAIVIPEGDAQFYTEKVVTLPGSYQVNDSRRAIAADTDRAAHGLPEAGFVFCNFNQSYKLTPEVFAAWVRILKQVPGSVLWLLEMHPVFRENLSREAERQGIAADRLVFAPTIALDRHLARLKLADLFLDTLPYNAHTTGSDALWAGVPLLTRRGTAFPGRVAASLLTAAGVPELITQTLADYEALAVKLAKDSTALKAIRDKIAGNRATCALFDTARTTRHIEAAYIRMWENRGKPPESFAISE